MRSASKELQYRKSKTTVSVSLAKPVALTDVFTLVPFTELISLAGSARLRDGIVIVGDHENPMVISVQLQVPQVVELLLRVGDREIKAGQSVLLVSIDVEKRTEIAVYARALSGSAVVGVNSYLSIIER